MIATIPFTWVRCQCECSNRLQLKDDPKTDAVALSKLTAAVQARRKARVPEWLFEARERLGKIQTTRFAFMMGHLRSGRGIASRPAKVA